MVLTVGALGAYMWVTRPAALRLRLERLFSGFDLRVERVASISFSPWRGLEVSGLVLDGEEHLSSPARGDRPGRHLLRVPHAQVEVDLPRLLTGRFRARRVRLDSPVMAVVWPPLDQLQRGSARRRFRFSAWRCSPASLPEIIIDDADVSVFVDHAGHLELQGRWVVDGRGHMTGTATKRLYALRLWQVGGALKAGRSGLLAGLRWCGTSLDVTLGWADLAVVQRLLPASWRQYLDGYGLSGQVRVSGLTFGPEGLRRAEVELADLALCLPMETDPALPPEQHYARLSKFAGTIRFSPVAQRGPVGGLLRGDVDVKLRGNFRAAPAQLDAHVSDLALTSLSPVGTGARENGGLGETTKTVGLTAAGFQATLVIDGLDLPTLRRDPAFARSPRLPGVVRSSLRKYNASGPVVLRLELAGARAAQPADAVRESPTTRPRRRWTLRYRGELRARGVRCAYYRFPYVVEDLRGTLRFSNDGVVIENLRGHHGAATIYADGRLNDSSSETGFDLVFRATNVPTDHDLYAALPPEYRKLWDNASPVALCDVRTTMHREQGDPATGSRPTRIVVDARLLSGSLCLGDDRLENVCGTVHIADKRVELHDLSGFLDGAFVSIDGRLDSEGRGGATGYDLHVEAAGMPVRRVSRVRTRGGDEIGAIRFDGVGDVWANLRSSDQGGNHYTAHITEGTLYGFDGTPGWRHTTGWVTIDGRRQTLRAVTARREGGTIEVAGALPARLGHEHPVTLSLRAEDADLDDLLRRLVPGKWARLRETLGLGGRGTLAVAFHPRNDARGTVQQAADFELHAERMRPKPVPLDLRDVEATLSLSAAGFELSQARARYGPEGVVEVSGKGGWEGDAAWSDVRIDARDVDLSANFVEAMPSPLAGLLRRLSPRGRARIALDQLRMRGSDRRSWDVIGSVAFENARMDLGVALTKATGRVRGRCIVRPDGRVALAADFEIDGGKLDGRPIERWAGQIVRKAGDPLVRLTDVRGRFCEGEVSGFVNVHPDTREYELSFDVRDVSLALFLAGKDTKTGQGRIDGHVFVRGRSDDPATRVGGGELRIRGASLLSSRVTRSVVEASRKGRRPLGTDVDQAIVRFVWEGDEMKFTHLDIQSRTQRMIGEGSWNTRTGAIALTLVGATPRGAVRVFPLTQVFEATGQELVQYRVRGTIKHPRVTVEPLHNLTEPLRRLLQGSNGG